jgi:sulfonate transport system substrate-binding protein
VFAYKRRELAAVAVAVGLILSAAACGDTDDSGGSSSDGATKIVVGTQPAITPDLAVPRIKGLWADAGLKPEYKTFNDGAAMLAALKSGDIDVAALAATPVITAMAQGIDIKIIGGGPQTGSAAGLLAEPDSGISSLEDLVGKKVGVPVGTGVAGAFDNQLAQAGIKDKVTVVNTATNIQITALEHGDVDAVVTFAPTSLVLEENGADLVESLIDWGNPNPTTLIVRSEYLEEHPDAVKDFIAGVDKGIDLVHSGDKEAIDAQAKELNIEPAVVQAFQENCHFPSVDEWVSDDYELSLTGGGLEDFLTDTAESLKTLGSIPDVPDIAGAIDPKPAQAYLDDK